MAAILAWSLLPATVNRGEEVVRAKPKPPRNYTDHIHFHRVQTGLSIPDEEAIRESKEKLESLDAPAGQGPVNENYGPLLAPSPPAKQEEKPGKRDWLSPLDLAGDDAPEAPEKKADDSGWGWLADSAGLIQSSEEEKRAEGDKEEDPTAGLSYLSLSNDKKNRSKDNVKEGSLSEASPFERGVGDKSLFRETGDEAEAAPGPAEEEDSVWTALREEDRSAFAIGRDQEWFAQKDVWRTDATRTRRSFSNQDMPQTRALLSTITAPLLSEPPPAEPRATPSSVLEAPGGSTPAASTPTPWAGLGALPSSVQPSPGTLGGRYGGALDTGVIPPPATAVGGSATFDPTRSFLDR